MYDILWGAFGGFIAFLFNTKISKMFPYKPVIALLVIMLLGLVFVLMLSSSGIILNPITATENGAAATVILSRLANSNDVDVSKSE